MRLFPSSRRQTRHGPLGPDHCYCRSRVIRVWIHTRTWPVDFIHRIPSRKKESIGPVCTFGVLLKSTAGDHTHPTFPSFACLASLTVLLVCECVIPFSKSSPMPAFKYHYDQIDSIPKKNYHPHSIQRQPRNEFLAGVSSRVLSHGDI